MKQKIMRLLSLLLALILLMPAKSLAVFAETISENEVKEEEEENGNDGQQEIIVDGNLSESNVRVGIEGPANPVHHCTGNDGTDYTDFSYVYFGSYPQSEVTDSATIAAINNAIATSETTVDVGMDVWVNGTKYRRISKYDTNDGGNSFDDMPASNGYRYFKWERIKWKVLNNDGNTLFVISDKAIDCTDYNEEWIGITWENSTIREWLNSNFYNIAFRSNEQNAIIEQTIANEDNPYYEDNPYHDVGGGSNTNDKIYLLSVSEVINESYGFCSNGSTYSMSRRMKASDYANARGTWRYDDIAYEGNCWWWLRSPGYYSNDAADVYSAGYIDCNDSHVNNDNGGVCPALHINLSSGIWSMVDDGTSGEGGNDTFTSQIAGTLQHIDAFNFTVTIDGKTYSVADDFAMNLPQQILLEDGSKVVVCTLSYGKIVKMEKAENIIEPHVDIVNCGDDITYQNGGFSTKTTDLQIRVRCGVKKSYNISSLNGLDDFGLTIDELKVTVPGEILNFGESGLFNKKKITEKIEKVNRVIHIGDALVYNYKINLQEDYTPPAYSKPEIEINAIVAINGEEINFTGKLPIMNLDYQKQIAEEKKAQRETTSKLTKAKKELQNLCNGSALALSAELSYYLQPDQIKQVEEYLYVWLAEVNNANTYTDDKNINKKIMAKLGINPNVGFLWKTTKADTRVVIGTVYGQKTFEFTLTLGTLQSNGMSYGAFGDIKYKVLEKDNVPKSVPTEGILGISTYVSMNNFMKCLQEVAESSVKDVYKELWGNNANEIASIVVDKTIMKLIDKKYGSFADGVYTIMTNPTKNYIKKMKVECPVDVYIYDMDDNLCGAIIDNVVDSSYSDIAMYVEGDTKVFYLTGDDYKLKLIGNDTGTMTYTIEEFGDNMANLRTVQFQEIPLADGKTYMGYVMEPPYIDNVLYALNTEDGQKIPADIDTYQDNRTERVYADGINLNASDKTLKVGESFQLSATVTPANATNQKNRWVSSDVDIVAVDNTGKVTAMKEGAAKVTAISDDGEFESICQIVVESGRDDKGEGSGNKNSIKISKLSIKSPSPKLAAGKKVKLTVDVTPPNVTNKVVSWKASNKKYATIDENGKLSLKKAGAGKTVTVTATAKDGSGKKATIKIKIMQHAVKGIKLKAPSKTLEAGKSMTVKATVSTTGKSVNKTLKWQSSNTKYATVNKKGKVTAKKAGKGKTVTITATSTDGSNKKAKVKIKIK